MSEEMMQQNTTKKQAEYAELLKKPQWQKRRLQMLEKADWKCVECGAKEQQLHVHHRRYIAGAKPWEYGDEDLAVLCEQCHEKAHGIESERPRPGAHRSPPSAAKTLLRLVMQHPDWGARLPASLIPDDSAEGRALAALIRSEPSAGGGLGAALERFRGTPHAETLARVAAEMVSAEFDESVTEALFKGAVRKLQLDALRCEIGSLLQKDRDRCLTDEDRERLAALLLEKRQMASEADEEDRRAEAEEAARQDRTTDEAVRAALEQLRAARHAAPSDAHQQRSGGGDA